MLGLSSTGCGSRDLTRLDRWMRQAGQMASETARSLWHKITLGFSRIEVEC